MRLPLATLLAMLGLTAVHWLLRYSLLYLAALGAGGYADWLLWTFLTQMLAMAASQFSFLPGGAGAAELGVGGLLLPLMEREQAAAAVLVSYQLYLAAGAPLFLLSAYRLVRRTPLTPEGPTRRRGDAASPPPSRAAHDVPAPACDEKQKGHP
ncbi:MAG: lysylphosphatidylglycerol synthase domain-containing protein [Pseudomonadota bacterium]